jgi:hypothetical protein
MSSEQLSYAVTDLLNVRGYSCSQAYAAYADDRTVKAVCDGYFYHLYPAADGGIEVDTNAPKAGPCRLSADGKRWVMYNGIEGLCRNLRVAPRD